MHSSASYELCEEDADDVDPPYCPHGPTLLFSQFNSEGEITGKFYACAACRSRKDCNFYQAYGKKETQEKKELRKQIYADYNIKNRLYQHLGDVLRKDVQFCGVCEAVVPSELCLQRTHSSRYKHLTAEEIKYPSRWLKPIECNKSNAQYFFSTQVIEFIGCTMNSHNIDQVLCIGTPTIYEHIKHSGAHGNVQTFLLDLDVRMRQFHSDYAHYNMFNNHFYSPEEQLKFAQFMRTCNSLMVIVDPPYGGLLQALARTFDKIMASTSCTTVVKLLFFPYFMDPQVSKHLPSLVMSDYKVDYSNHSGYRGASVGRNSMGKSRGSPARIFTDIPMREFVLPEQQGYSYCDQCERYVSKENSHCSKCGSCTTKDGPSYHHCDICRCCVKPSRVHCISCNGCQLKDHSCEVPLQSSVAASESVPNNRKHKRAQLTLPKQPAQCGLGEKLRVKKRPKR